MDTKFFKKTAMVFGLGLATAVGAISASAQNVDKQYRQWQRAQQRAEMEHRDYLRTGSAREYRQWQNAQIRAQREYMQYQQARNGYNNGYYNNEGYYNNSGYYNNGTNGVQVYRVYRDGQYYTTDSRGAELLRRAVQNGYSRGYQQGQVDRRYGRGANYTINNTYRSGTYGWQSYVARDQYQYYFQQGFQRGYEDGYNSTYRYGVRSGNGFNILSNVLSSILSFVN